MDKETKEFLENMMSFMNNEFKRLEERMDDRFNKFENKFGEFENRFDTLENRFDTLENRFDTLENRFDTLESRFDTLENRFDTLENKVDKNTMVLENLEDKVETLAELHKSYINENERHLNNIIQEQHNTNTLITSSIQNVSNDVKELKGKFEQVEKVTIQNTYDVAYLKQVK